MIRPKDRTDIRVKAYAVFTRDQHILVNEVRESDGTLKGYRIPGGHVEFGERALDAIIREIKEELDADITDVTPLPMLENIFMYNGIPGHEVTFSYKARFKDKSLYAKEEIIGDELGTKFTLFWADPENMPGGLPLFPFGLKDIL